jgi:hypothetical protein
MRLISSVTILVVLVAANSVRADENEACRAILDKAVNALGGEPNLKKCRAATWNYKTTGFAAGLVLEGTGKEAVEWPERYRVVIQSGGVTALYVINGNKGWEQTPDGTREMDKKWMTAMRGDLYFKWLPATILPLREKTFKLEEASEEKVLNRPAAAINVSPRDGPAFTIYFDKENGLPVRMTMKVKEEGTGNESVTERLYTDYKEIRGIKKAMKIVVNDLTRGTKSSETEIADFQFAEKLDAKLFAKPE